MTQDMIERLMEIEAGVRYSQPPGPGESPFVVVRRNSAVILSAPHGAVTYRGNDKEEWHAEDEYTAGMALLLSELCGTSAVATTRLTSDSDPNEHDEMRSPYKQALRKLAAETGARWVLDLHGAGLDYPGLAETQAVDLGVGAQVRYLPQPVYDEFVRTLERNLWPGAADRQGHKGFPAKYRHRIAAFAHLELGLGAVQVEMKPTVRMPIRRLASDKTFRPRNPAFVPSPARVRDMLRALAEFIGFLEEYQGEG